MHSSAVRELSKMLCSMRPAAVRGWRVLRRHCCKQAGRDETQSKCGMDSIYNQIKVRKNWVSSDLNQCTPLCCSFQVLLR